MQILSAAASATQPSHKLGDCCLYWLRSAHPGPAQPTGCGPGAGPVAWKGLSEESVRAPSLRPKLKLPLSLLTGPDPAPAEPGP